VLLQLQLQHKISKDVEEKLSKYQREMLLREQLKVVADPLPQRPRTSGRLTESCLTPFCFPGFCRPLRRS
jgi:ATP-dependent Lon protease